MSPFPSLATIIMSGAAAKVSSSNSGGFEPSHCGQVGSRSTSPVSGTSSADTAGCFCGGHCGSFHCLRSLSLAHSVRLSCGLHRRRRQRQTREHHILFVATHTCSRLYTASYTGESTCNTSGTNPGPSLQQAHVLDDLHHEQVPAPATPAVASEAQVMQPNHVRCSRRSTS